MQSPTHQITRMLPDRSKRATILHTRVVAGTGGGPEKTILNSPRYIEPSCYRMAAAYIHPTGDPGIQAIRRRARALHCRFYPIAERSPFDPRTLSRLLHLCRRLDVRVWHAHDYKTDALGLLLRRWHPMKLVTTVHNWVVESSRLKLYRSIDLRCLRHYDHVIAVSSEVADTCRGAGVEPERLTMISNAIELGAYQPAAHSIEAKHQLGITPDRLVMATVGRLSPEKGMDRLLPVVQALVKRNPQLLLLIIGDGPQRPALEQQVAELGLQSSVRFCGWQDPLQPWYRAMDLFILPSYMEGLPNVVLEAMAMRVPVAATDVGGVRDLLDDGKAGVILPELADSWEQLLHTMLQDAERRHALATAARCRVESCFSFENRMRRVSAIYDRLLHEKSIAMPSAAARAREVA